MRDPNNVMLIQGNNLNKTASGVWDHAESNSEFGYSDGVDSDQYLTKVLQDASDLSSTSSELESKIRDWPSEYHLSNKRGNLLRGLNFSPKTRVLELGCGCGAITRYLGDQGFDVDAIEGSKVRAELAALRCRGLDNVNIICSNFNDLNIPDNTYDCVLLIGVVEYAARFWPQQISEEQAVIELLKTVRRSLRQNGTAVVAIENRTGMKYILGAHEDHCSKRYIGIHGYPEEHGIKTYTQGEWATLIKAAGFNTSKYLFPFPDYKVPTVLLSEMYTLTNPQVYMHLEGVLSRDYLMILDLDAQEPMFWESASANETIPKFSNSFLILMGDDASILNTVADSDFVHFPDFKRKTQYWVITKKKSGSETVERIRVQTRNVENIGGVTHQLQNETFIHGNLLSVDWSRSLLIEPKADRFKRYLAEYYDYLEHQTLYIDLVPNNIVVDGQGSYHYFDQEWQVDWALNRDYLLFRALMLFAIRHKSTLREFARWYSLYTIREFIQFCFNELHIDVKDRMEGFISMEKEFQDLVNRPEASGTVVEQLEIKISEPAQVGPVYARIYWKKTEQPDQRTYNEADSVTVEVFPENETAKLIFELPNKVSNISHLHFDPCDERSMHDIGFLRIPYFRVEAIDGGEEKQILLIQGNENLATQGTLSGIVFNKASYGDIFAVVNKNPEIEFELNTLQRGQSLHSYKVEVHCTHVRSKEYQLVRDRFLIQEEVLKRKLSHLEGRYKRLQQEIKLIKESKVWTWGQRCKSILGRGGM